MHNGPRSLQVWLGMSFGAWWTVLRRNRFAVAPAHLHRALLITAVSLINSSLGHLQRKALGAQISTVQIAPAPVFIVGHGRSGTTFLHELLACDWRHSFPNTYECFAANHFLLSQEWAREHLGFLLPERRAVDSMAVGWERPHEDEFALCNQGLRSPLHLIAFPRQPLGEPSGERVDALPEAERRQWMAALEQFLRCVLLRRPGRLIVKSPTHAFRLRTLAEMFPEARFVHMVRDPAAVFPSTLRLMNDAYRNHSLQSVRSIDLAERVLGAGERMFRAFLDAKGEIPAGRLVDVRYEDLIERPEPTLERLYDALDLGDFAPARAAVRAYLAETQGHSAGTYARSADEIARVWDRWGFYYEQYGYRRPPSPATGAG